MPYGIRHFMITNRIQSGVTYSDVAFMCGTSIKQIKNTYYHVSRETLPSSLPRFNKPAWRLMIGLLVYSMRVTFCFDLKVQHIYQNGQLSSGQADVSDKI